MFYLFLEKSINKNKNTTKYLKFLKYLKEQVSRRIVDLLGLI